LYVLGLFYQRYVTCLRHCHIFIPLSVPGEGGKGEGNQVIYESTKSLGKYPKREGKGGRRKRKIDGIPREEEEGKRSTLCDYIK